MRTYRIDRRNKAIEQLKKIHASRENTLIIHYSCESFYNIEHDRTPRITSIAVRYMNSAQTKSFSIHKIAEINKIPFENIEQEYDRLEKKMLDEFFEFVREYKLFNWLHWNMRDQCYGFEAINNRYRVLRGVPELIDNSRKYDLARILIDKYGVTYAKHPRLKNITQKNRISHPDFLIGKDEAKAFNDKEFFKLHLSTLRKIDIIHNIFLKAIDDRLRTNSKMTDIYGITPQGIHYLIKDHWLFAFISFVLGIIICILLQNIFS